jgi:TATA-box binding protein (TBP) (component of TFIID and TFIIIB)
MFLIRNIKISVKVEALTLNNALSVLKNKNIATREFGNFFSFKSNQFTFVIFKRGSQEKNHINITQIPNFYSIHKAINSLISLLNCRVCHYVIDNIIATSDLHKPISLYAIIKSKRFKRVKYNSEIFPGLFIKFKEGTTIIFHSGKLVIVGCKSIDKIQCILTTIHANITT